MPPSAADVALPRMPPCARATVGQSWERSWPASTKRYSVGLPSPDRELPSRGSLHSSRTLGSGLPISTLFSLVIYVAGIVRGKNVGTPFPPVLFLSLLKPLIELPASLSEGCYQSTHSAERKETTQAWRLLSAQVL